LKRLFLLLVAALALLVPVAGQAASGPVLNFYAPNTTTPAITNFAYGPVLPGQSVSKTFTLKNTGGSATAALKITLAKTAGATGAFTKTGDTCSQPVPISLGKGKTCQITIRFAPVAGGESDAADLTAVSKKPNASKTLHLTGSGAAPNVQITPASKDFGTAAGTLQTFTATNNGTAASGTYAFASPGSPFFVVTFGPQANTCTGTALAIGASCSFTVVYAADVCSGNATYEKTAALGSLASVTVTATEPACPHITVSPTSHDFGTTSGTKQTFTFTNDGGAGRVMSTAFDPDNGVFEAPGAFACQSEILQTGESCSVEITLSLPEGCGASYSGFLRHGMATVGGSSGGNTATATFTAAQPACAIDIRDDCDPATFNEAVPGDPPTCVGDGTTTFDSYIDQITANGLVVNGSAEGWEFAPGTLQMKASQSITLTNSGGEFHTFTPVASFGPGVVDVLNEAVGLPAGPPVPECVADAVSGFAATGLAPGETRTLSNLSVGVHLFQDCIHPWQRATVTVVN
jgi:hypothetical protein